VVGTVVATQIALAIAVWAMRIETRGRRLEELEVDVSGSEPAARGAREVAGAAK
jgi:hypothetical protein